MRRNYEEYEEQDYYEQFEFEPDSPVVTLMKKTAFLIRSLIIAVVVLAVLIGYVFFFTDVEFKHDPRDQGPKKITEKVVTGAYNDDVIE